MRKHTQVISLTIDNTQVQSKVHGNEVTSRKEEQ